MASRAERLACCDLRAILDDLEVGAEIPESDEMREFLVSLEYLLPAALREEHPWWRYESLDGILPAVARKTGAREAEVVGLCFLMSDNALVPLYVRLRLAREVDEIELLNCKLGECGEGNGGIQRCYDLRPSRHLALVAQRVTDIHWAYTARIGSRTSS